MSDIGRLFTGSGGFYRPAIGRQARFADFSQTILTDLERLTRALPPGARVVIEDDDAPSGVKPATMMATFGAQLGDAHEVRAGHQLDLLLAPDAPIAPRGPRS